MSLFETNENKVTGKIHKLQKTIRIVVGNNDNSKRLLKLKCPNNTDHIYRHLDDRGLPNIGSNIEVDDCIIGLIDVSNNDNVSKIADIGEDGQITYVGISSCNCDNDISICIKIVKNKFFKFGDEPAVPYAQIGAVSQYDGDKIIYDISDNPTVHFIDSKTIPVRKYPDNMVYCTNCKTVKDVTKTLCSNCNSDCFLVDDPSTIEHFVEQNTILKNVDSTTFKEYTHEKDDIPELV